LDQFNNVLVNLAMCCILLTWAYMLLGTQKSEYD